MDFPDLASTASSSPTSTVSNVSETLSSIALLYPDDEKPRTLPDLPSEIILQIYEHLEGPLEVIALNSTSRMYYWVWRTNAASISRIIFSRSITGYKNALELFEVDERLKQIHCIMLPQFVIQKRIRVAQRQARDAVQRGCHNDRWDHISKEVCYRSVLHRNHQLYTAAREANHLLGLIKSGVIHMGGTSPARVNDQSAPSGKDIIVAYHEIVILIRLRCLKAMKDRLKTMCKGKIRKMLHVATYLVRDCPDADKIRLNISRRVTSRIVPWSWVIDDCQLDPTRPRCQMTVSARRAFFAVADSLGDARIPDHLVDNRSGCRGDCEEAGEGYRGEVNGSVDDREGGFGREREINLSSEFWRGMGKPTTGGTD